MTAALLGHTSKHQQSVETDLAPSVLCDRRQTSVCLAPDEGKKTHANQALSPRGHVALKGMPTVAKSGIPTPKGQATIFSSRASYLTTEFGLGGHPLWVQSLTYIFGRDGRDGDDNRPSLVIRQVSLTFRRRIYLRISCIRPIQKGQEHRPQSPPLIRQTILYLRKSHFPLITASIALEPNARHRQPPGWKTFWWLTASPSPGFRLRKTTVETMVNAPSAMRAL
jgi:hypothetical protein